MTIFSSLESGKDEALLVLSKTEDVRVACLDAEFGTLN